MHNSLKGWTLYDLSDREVQLLLASMSVNEQKLARICQAGDLSWAICTDQNYPQFFKNNLGTHKSYPKLDFPDQAERTAEYFIVQTVKKGQTPRLHKRFSINAACFIRNQTKQFKTNTVDLSEGGLHFTDLIPDWVAGYFIVELHTQTQMFQLMCSLVEDQSEKKRVQIVSEDSDPQYVHYKNWIQTLK